MGLEASKIERAVEKCTPLLEEWPGWLGENEIVLKEPLRAARPMKPRLGKGRSSPRSQVSNGPCAFCLDCVDCILGLPVVPFFPFFLGRVPLLK